MHALLCAAVQMCTATALAAMLDAPPEHWVCQDQAAPCNRCVCGPRACSGPLLLTHSCMLCRCTFCRGGRSACAGKTMCIGSRPLLLSMFCRDSVACLPCSVAFIIQSTSFSTEHLDQRCEAFLQGFRQTLQDMDETSFAKQVRGYREWPGTCSAAAEGVRGAFRGGAAHHSTFCRS